jgi:hypothetical protein
MFSGPTRDSGLSREDAKEQLLQPFKCDDCESEHVLLDGGDVTTTWVCSVCGKLAHVVMGFEEWYRQSPKAEGEEDEEEGCDCPKCVGDAHAAELLDLLEENFGSPNIGHVWILAHALGLHVARHATKICVAHQALMDAMQEAHWRLHEEFQELDEDDNGH